MRIIAGRLKGRRLARIRSDIRPTSDRLRGSLFDSLGSTLEGSVWLDAMAGSGAVGLEALSRGASQVHFNDRDPGSRQVIARNLDLCCVAEGFEIHARDVFVLIRELKVERPFTHLFFDPPYDFGRYDKLLNRIAASALAGPGSLVILERIKRGVPPSSSALETLQEIKAGESLLTLYRKKGEG